MEKLFRWDEEQWPIVVARFPDGEFGEPAMAEYFTRVEAALERKEPFAVVVVHESTGGGMDKHARVLAATKTKARADEFRAYQKALAVVSTSMVARTALTAIGWIAPFPYPSKAFRQQAEALAWVRRRLSA